MKNVVHYDLKCDNILLESLDSAGLESEFWTPRWPPEDPSKPLPFRICIADFGQSKVSSPCQFPLLRFVPLAPFTTTNLSF